jgi:hypothetical protein
VFEKISKAKRVGSEAPVVEWLPGKCEALSSNPSIAPPKELYTEG